MGNISIAMDLKIKRAGTWMTTGTLGELTTNLYYRVYGKYFNRDGFEDKEGRDMDDNWHLGRGGARLDWEASERNTFTLSGDYYRGEFGEQVQKTGLPFTNAFFGVDAPTSGGNVLGR